jgi:hypothetical protein
VSYGRSRWAIQATDAYKSLEDGIFLVLLQEDLKVLMRPMMEIYTYGTCIALRYIPISWRVVRVIFTPTPGHNNYTPAKSFCPISLTYFLLKTLKRLVDRYKSIQDGALMRYRLHVHQHAHQTGGSTLHSLVHKLDSVLENGFVALGASRFESMFRTAEEHRLEHNAWVHAMLRRRKILMAQMGCMMRVSVSQECPQGGVLTPEACWSMNPLCG